MAPGPSKPKINPLLAKKIATWAAIAVVMLFILNMLIFSPASELNSRRDRLKKELRELRTFNEKEKTYKKKLRTYAAGSFSLNPNEAANTLRARMLKIIQASGMRETAHDTTNITGKSPKGAFKSIGRKYILEGTLEQTTNLLYLLDKDPYLCKVDSLTISPLPDGQKVKVSFCVMTLALEKRKGEVLKTADLAQLKPIAELKGNGRGSYQSIVKRNLFRPYVKKPKPRPQPRHQPRPQLNPNPQPQPQPDPGRFLKLVDLSQYGKSPEIAFLDLQTHTVKRYNAGNKLNGATIVMVDYRALPKPSVPDEMSFSRVILRTEKGYWAIEIGSTLDQKRLLKRDDLPPSLQSSLPRK